MADQHHHGSDPLVGRLFNDYVIEEQLARGGMGAVYMCRHRELPHLRKVLKVIASELEAPPDPSASPAARASAERARAFVCDRFEREAWAVAQLQHRYIVPIDGIGTLDGRRCILMPFLDGRSLEELLKERGRLTAHETLHIVVQIARAVDHAHRRGIVHRDLKPGNIFIVPSEDDPLEIRVIDFGIAKQMQPGGAATAWGDGPLGTMMFMAVEQFERPNAATPQSDVYALAVMTYLMIEERYPWGEQPTMFAQYRRQLDTPPDPASVMLPEWEASVHSALSPDPAQRPRSMHEFVYPLAVALGGLEILRRIAPRWASSSPDDETLRGTATTGAWRAAFSGAWIAASGSWPAAASEAWPSGAWPGASTELASSPVPAAASAEPASSPVPVFSASPSALPAPAPPPTVSKLVLLATVAAVLACLVVYVLVRALEGQ